jgi:hypothetical protein
MIAKQGEDAEDGKSKITARVMEKWTGDHKNDSWQLEMISFSKVEAAAQTKRIQSTNDGPDMYHVTHTKSHKIVMNVWQPILLSISSAKPVMEIVLYDKNEQTTKAITIPASDCTNDKLVKILSEHLGNKTIRRPEHKHEVEIFALL